LQCSLAELRVRGGHPSDCSASFITEKPACCCLLPTRTNYTQMRNVAATVTQTERGHNTQVRQYTDRESTQYTGDTQYTVETQYTGETQYRGETVHRQREYTIHS